MSQSGFDADSARNELYELMQADVEFEEKVTRALELGEQYLGVENGHLTRIDQEWDSWKAIASTDPPDGSFPPGLELDLNTTYCRRTLESDSPIALHDAPEQGWDDDPAFETHGLRCYHGTTVTVDGDPYGTVCFVSEGPRSKPFDDGETMFAELIGRLLERELEYHIHESELDRRANLINVLNRVLRHNLRNDITVVRGRLQQLTSRHDVDDEICDPLFGKLDELVALSETARELDSIVTEEFERGPTDLVGLTRRVAETVESDYPDSTVTVRNQEEVVVEVMPSLSTAVRELVENGVKHCDEPEPSVTVTIEPVSDSVEIRISDDGPGLPAEERAVLRGGVETALEHGSGLGLWLVYWIVTGHGGAIDTTVSDDGTDVTITLPHSHTPAVATSAEGHLAGISATEQ